MIKKINQAHFLKFISDTERTELSLYYDLETFSYNLGAEKPSFFKSKVWSLAISYYDDMDNLTVVLFHNFKEFFEVFLRSATKTAKTKVTLIAHNGNKYDNHFLRRSLIDDFQLIPRTGYNKTSLEHEHEVKQRTVQNGKYLLEKRIKSKTQVELDFQLNKKYRFNTLDTIPKTNASLRTLGYKAFKAGLLPESALKTEMNYDSYNFDNDLSDEIAEKTALKYFDEMDDLETEYIINDVYILGVVCRNYYTLFHEFDFEKRTMSLNVLDVYVQNNQLAQFQMTGKYGEDHRDKLDLTKFAWDDKTTLYTYLRRFYKGGLNFLNERYQEKPVHGRMFSIDLNSSYPNVMYHEKFPTFLNSLEEHADYIHKKDAKDKFVMLEITKDTMNELLEDILSDNIRKMLVKYFNNVLQENVFINNVIIDIINMFTTRKIRTIPAVAILTFETEYFGGRDKIFDFYKIKSQGKQKNKIEWISPTEYTITDKENDRVFTPPEIDNAKLNLNMPYGIPALRKFFNVFKYKDGELTNFKNGHENSSRNMLFAICTTAHSLRNLLTPLSVLLPFEIDKYFYYCDTDSLYLDYKVYPKIEKATRFDPIALGAWDVEHDNLTAFFIQNHKKYCFMEDDKISVRSGGIDVQAFDVYEKYPTEYKAGEVRKKRKFTPEQFDEFCLSKFCTGTVIYNNSSVLNEDETITIYKRATQLSRKNPYDLEFNGKRDKQVADKMLEMIQESIETSVHGSDIDDGVFIEAENLGAYSIEDIERANIEEDTSELQPARKLIIKGYQIKKYFGM